MSDNTSIEWTDATWNPIRGVKGRWSCVKVSPGCTNCYAEAMNVRFGGPRYTVGADELRLDEKALTEPLRWKKPRRVFVCSMTDLFEERVPDEWIDRVFAVMARTPRHTFQVLTKRPERMLDWFSLGESEPFQPLPNVWLGVSVEDQERAEERVPLLLQTPAAVRFVSAEPLLGPLDFGWLDLARRTGTTLDWVIVGGESGPGARPMYIAWAHQIVTECRGAGVPVFVKQLGSYAIDPARILRDGVPIRGEAIVRLRDRKGGDPSEWPEDLRVREWPR